MANDKAPGRPIDPDAALRQIVEGTALQTGERFFEALVENLARALAVKEAWVTEYIPALGRLRALAFWFDGKFVPDYEYDVAGTPCEPVIQRACLVHFPENVVDLFPNDPDLKPLKAFSYMGAPLEDLDGSTLGHVAVLDGRAMPEEPRMLAVFRIFAGRAAAELRRLRAEAEVRERERKLSQLLACAMDAVIEVDSKLRITLMNSAAEKVFKCRAEDVTGHDFGRFLLNESRTKLEALMREIDALPEGERRLWIPRGLEARCSGGETFPAEATLSGYALRRKPFYTLILRNLNDRIEAERKIRSLTEETLYLREEIRALQKLEDILGESEALQRVLREVQEVAKTDTTVLILGETGTGKELVARAIHGASRRHTRNPSSR